MPPLFVKKINLTPAWERYCLEKGLYVEGWNPAYLYSKLGISFEKNGAVWDRHRFEESFNKPPIKPLTDFL